MHFVLTGMVLDKNMNGFENEWKLGQKADLVFFYSLTHRYILFSFCINSGENVVIRHVVQSMFLHGVL